MKNFNLKTLFLLLVGGFIASCFIFSGVFDFHIFNASPIGLNEIMATAPAALVGERKLFEQLKKKYGAIGVPSPAYLRIESTLTNSQGKYSFDIKRTGNETATERKLDRNDLFVVTRIGLYLLKEDSTKIGLGVLNTFPNSTEFVAASGFTPAHLETIYSGYFSLKTGQKVNIEAMSNQVFRYVSTSQKSGSIGQSEFNVSEYAYIGAEDIYLHGTKSHEITIEFPTFNGMQIGAVAANTKNKLVFHPFGYLIKNGADGIGTGA